MGNDYGRSVHHAHDLTGRGPLGDWQRSASKSGPVEEAGESPHHAPMSDITRSELDARLSASEAKVDRIVERMRADAAELRADLKADSATLRADMREALSDIKASGESAKANADRFYAEAKTLLAESRAALTEIRLAGEQNKTVMMGMGYKVITWTLGTILAIGGVSVGVYNALKPKGPFPPPAPAQLIAPELILRQQAPLTAPTDTPPPPAKP
jgi:hypothetical protein